MDLSPDDVPVAETHLGNSLPLPPPTSAVPLPQARELANSGAGRYRLDLRYRSDDVELHAPMLSKIQELSNHVLLCGITSALRCVRFARHLQRVVGPDLHRKCTWRLVEKPGGQVSEAERLL